MCDIVRCAGSGRRLAVPRRARAVPHGAQGHRMGGGRGPRRSLQGAALQNLQPGLPLQTPTPQSLSRDNL